MRDVLIEERDGVRVLFCASQVDSIFMRNAFEFIYLLHDDLEVFLIFEMISFLDK